MNYFFHILIMIGIYLPLAYSLNLTLGFGGLMSFCHAAFYGLGAYSFAILVKSINVNPGLSVVLTILITTIVSLGISLFSLRFRGSLFLLATLGFQMIFFAILYNSIPLTNGPYGIAGIVRPSIFGLTLRTPFQYLILVILMNFLILMLLFALYRSPFGLTLKSLREDETACQAMGINPRRTYTQAFVLSAVFAAFPGIFYATYLTYIDPSAFTIDESIFQAAILLLGGAGNRKGPFWGVVIMILLPEALRFFWMPDTVAHNLREIIYGLVLVFLMYFRPQGIAGEFKVT